MTTLSEEDFEILRDSASRFFAEQMPVSSMRRIRDEKHPDGFERDMWQGMSGMGWSGILIDEDNGGLAPAVVPPSTEVIEPAAPLDQRHWVMSSGFTSASDAQLP